MASKVMVTVQNIRKIADALEKAHHYIDALEAMNDTEPTNAVVQSVPAPKATVKRPRVAGGRVGEIKDFLIKHGPSARKDIIAKSGIPQGTVSLYLKEKNGFDHDKETGLWSAKKEKDKK